MIKFRNEITSGEWIFGSVIITVMIWVNYLFPVFSNTSSMVVQRVSFEASKYLLLYPQNIKSLPFGIITSQFYHINNFHLSSNISLLIIFMIILAKISARFITIISLCTVLSGLLIWAFHPVKNEYTNLLGASGLIFALLGYICLRIILNIDLYQEIGSKLSLKASNSIAVSFWVSFVSLSIIMIYWENMLSLMIVKNDTSEISVHGHLIGFISGVIVYLLEIIFLVYRNNKQQH